MAALQFPCVIFKTKKIMDDYGADDMQYGDLSESQLKKNFNLVDVSARANPYTLTKISPFTHAHSMYPIMRGEGEKLTKQACVRILFDEFRYLSSIFALYGPYKYLIENMITHMQNGNGAPFSSLHLNAALKEQILSDRTVNSTLLRIKGAIEENIDWEKGHYPEVDRNEILKAIHKGRLPKFNRFQDNFNGMGITVHDVWAVHITIKYLKIQGARYHAQVHYKVQDHFGLDDSDILKSKFYNFRFFRIWFVLQRYSQFGFKPFMTNMETTVDISGERHG